MKTIYYAIVVTLILVACNDNNATSSTTTEGQAVTTETSVKEVEVSTQENTDIFDFLSTEEVTAMRAIQKAFEQYICDGISESKNNKNCYLTHAQGFSFDVFNDISYKLSFPYNGVFDLSQVDEHVSKLQFLTKNCGFQNEDTGEIINYHCLKLESGWMDYLQILGESSSLIKEFHNGYQATKTVTPDMRQSLVLRASNDLNFEQEGDQLFYMLTHLLVNEEKIAHEKIKVDGLE